jgi:hypothetical protein
MKGFRPKKLWKRTQRFRPSSKKIGKKSKKSFTSSIESAIKVLMSATKKETKRNGNAANQGGKWIRTEKRLAIYLRDGLTCAYCGAQMEQGDTQLTLDHVTAQELGGTNSETNLVCCCKSCNSAKQAKPLRAFLACLARRSIRKWKRIAKAVLKARN